MNKQTEETVMSNNPDISANRADAFTALCLGSRLRYLWPVLAVLLVAPVLAGFVPDGDPEKDTHVRLDPPEIVEIGVLEFYQLDTLRVGLDTLVNDEEYPPEEMRWELELLDTRFGDNPNSEKDQHLVYELDEGNRTLLFTSTPFFAANDIRLRLRVRNPEGETDTRVFRVSVLSVEDVPGKVFELRQNWPNPFSGHTTLEYWIPVRSRVLIRVYDLLGRHVQTLVDRTGHDPGVHRMEWAPSRLSSGVYVVILEARGVDNSRFAKSIRLTYLR